MKILETHFGETLALLTAVNWALAVILFRKSGERVHPIGLNLFKDLLAIALLIPTIYLMGGTMFRDVPAGDYVLLLASGAIGIGIADTLFFKSLNALGGSLTAIVSCTYSPFIIALSIPFLGETLAVLQILGVVLIVGAVVSALEQRKLPAIDGRKIVAGVIWGVLATATNAIGIVMIKPLLEASPLPWATQVRLIGGSAVLLMVLMLRNDRRFIINSLISSERWGYIISGSVIGAYLSMMLWLAGMKYTQASIAAALNQTSHIFIFVFAWLLLREGITRGKLIGIALGVAGATLVTFG